MIKPLNRKSVTQTTHNIYTYSYHNYKVGLNLNATKIKIDQINHNQITLTIDENSKKYLLPSMVGRSKNNSFQSIKNRVWKQIQGWKEKLLSKGGKEVLIKAEAQAIPTTLWHALKSLLPCVKN